MSNVIPRTAGQWVSIGRCACGAVVYPDSFRDRASYREAMLHHLQCQECQDRLFFALSEDGTLRYPIRRGVIVAPERSNGVVCEIGLLPFIFVAPESGRMVWEAQHLLRAGPNLVLPGRLGARYDSSEREIRFDCEPRKVSGCRKVRGDTVFARQYASRYTAVGRFGEGRPEDGFPVQRRDFSWARTAVDARMRLKDLMLHSCALAHEEGLTIYTVSLLSPGQSLSDGWKDQLVTCSGTAGTASNAERENYHLQGTDRDSLVSAFRTIGKRLVTVRRTS